MRFADNSPLTKNEMEVHISSYKPNGKFYCSATLRDDKVEVGTAEWYAWLQRAVPDLGPGSSYVVIYTPENRAERCAVEYDHNVIFRKKSPTHRIAVIGWFE